MNKSSDATPHLAIVVHSLGAGGAERVVADLSRWWAKQARTVTVITQTGTEADVYSLHPSVHRIALHTAKNTTGKVSALISNLHRVRRLRQALRRIRPSVVLGIMPTSSMLAILASQGMRWRVIASEHTHPPAQPLPAFWSRLRRWCYPRAASVVALTDGTAEWLERHVPGSRVTVIPNAVHWPIADTAAGSPPPSRRGRYRLLAVGRLHPIKGLDRLIAAFAQLAHQQPDWDLVILGEGAQRAALEAQIQQAGLHNRISMPGRVDNVAAWYAAADLYVLSSRAEGLSNTLLEAMASGLPVVAVDCDTGPRSIITHGVDGLLVTPADDVQALATSLSDLMSDAGRRQRLGRQAREVRTRYAPASIMARWDELLT